MEIERLQASSAGAHGVKGNAEWTFPRLVAASDKLNRPNQVRNQFKANEFLDELDVLEQKVNILVEFIKNAKYCVAYTGAGLSRTAGIPDYASKAENSIVNNIAPKLKRKIDAQPTLAHRVIVALERAGYISNCVQQNHDGLPQKAGFPQEKINEIHGAWHDPSNPVVQINGSLRDDLYQWMVDVEQRADLCLCLGTSLSGMNSDRIASTPCKRMFSNPDVFGTVIVNLQQTRLDENAAIRIWAKLDDVFEMVAQKLNLDMTPVPPVIDTSMNDKFIVPYDREGKLDTTKRTIWDLSKGAEVTIKNPRGDVPGKISSKDAEGNYIIALPHFSTMILGRWWVNTALRGSYPTLPITNAYPKYAKLPTTNQ